MGVFIALITEQYSPKYVFVCVPLQRVGSVKWQEFGVPQVLFQACKIVTGNTNR